MACQVDLFKALCLKLAEDDGTNGLVRLLLHAPSKGPDYVRIGRDMPDVTNNNTKGGWLGIKIPSSTPFLFNSGAPLYQAFIEFRYGCCGYKADLRTIEIGDRLESLLYGTAGPDAPAELGNTFFLDFSNCDVTVKSNTFIRRSRDERPINEDTDRWREKIVSRVVWTCEGCSDC